MPEKKEVWGRLDDSDTWICVRYTNQERVYFSDFSSVSLKNLLHTNWNEHLEKNKLVNITELVTCRPKSSCS